MADFWFRPPKKFWAQNRPWLVCAKSIFTLILKVSDKFIEKCRRSRLFGEWHLGEMGFWDMATLVSFWSFFGDRMADLGLIDSKRGLYIKINVNNGQNKFEVHISKNVAKLAILWPKIGQRHFGARASHGHNLAIFHQILTNEHTKMTSSLRRIEWNTY